MWNIQRKTADSDFNSDNFIYPKWVIQYKSTKAYKTHKDFDLQLFILAKNGKISHKFVTIISNL